MKRYFSYKIMFFLSAILLVFIDSVFAKHSSLRNSDSNIALRPPPFANIAKAESNQPATFADDEAGIAAYINAGQTIDLSKVDDLCRSISEQNANYLICAIDVPDYDENHSPTVYTHKDGWVMAYYRNTEPVSKIIDFRHYTGDANLSTKFEQVINLVVAKIGAPAATPAYYHFAYPNAQKMLLIAEKADPGRSDDFQVNLPSGFSYFEQSWALVRDDASTYTVQYDLDGQKIAEIKGGIQGRWEYVAGKFTRNQMPDGNHTIVVAATNYIINAGYGGLALIYSGQ